MVLGLVLSFELQWAVLHSCLALHLVFILESVSLLIMGHYHSINLALLLVLGLFPVGEVDFLHVQTKIRSCSLTFDLASIERGCLLLKILWVLVVWPSYSFFKYYISRSENGSSYPIKQFVTSMSKIAN